MLDRRIHAWYIEVTELHKTTQDGMRCNTMEQKTITSRLSLPEDLNRKILAAAAITGKTKPDIIIEILRKEFDKK